MGIVMTLAMLLGLVALWRINTLSPQLSKLHGLLLVLAGLWNSVWHGLRHLNQFWGQAAIVSGVAMIFAATYLLLSKEEGKAGLRHWPGRLVFVLLLGCFLLYAITLVQLNLGLAIIS